MLTLPVWATPSAEELKAAYAALPADGWVHRPAFSDKEWSRLAADKTVRRRERLDGPDRVLGALWTEASHDQLWLAIQDEGCFETLEGYVDEDLPGSTFANRTLYQRIDLPWPFAARQWVVDIRSNRALLIASDGAVWERSWTQSDRRGAKAEDPDAVWVPETEGGWTLIGLAGGTLLVYHTRASPGGAIPEEAGTQWALMTVASVVEDADERARTVIDAHYVAGHAAIERPDGSIVEFRPPMNRK
jgi:hypothetical protein